MATTISSSSNAFIASCDSGDSAIGHILLADYTGVTIQFMPGPKLPLKRPMLLTATSTFDDVQYVLLTSPIAFIATDESHYYRFSLTPAEPTEVGRFLSAYVDATLDSVSAHVDIIESEESQRKYLLELVHSVNLPAAAFPSTREFLESREWVRAGCTVLDVRLAGIGGVELLKRMQKMGSPHLMIFVTRYGTMRTAVSAMKTGAFDFFEKPADAQELLDRIHQALAIAQENAARTRTETLGAIRSSALTTREWEVVRLLLDGRSSKEVATVLRVSKKTVDHHRAAIMRKLNVQSIAELVAVVLQSPPFRNKHLSHWGRMP